MKLIKTITALIAISLFGVSYANAGSHAYTGPDLSGEKLTIFGPWLAPQDDDFRDVISIFEAATGASVEYGGSCLLYTSPSPRDLSTSRMPSSA